MLLNFQQLIDKYKVKSNGVIHCGAHFGEEHKDYIEAGIQDIVFIEPCRKAFDELMRRFLHSPRVRLFNMACGDEPGTSIMYTGDNTINKGQSNSLLKPLKHLDIHPTVEFTDEEEVNVDRLDRFGLIGGPYDMLVMDCQGYEGHVLRGAKNILKQINWVYSEVNSGEVYENCTQVAELDTLLHEFERVETGQWVGGMWSDAFYVRKFLLK
jgi:FkbM family methyltransferase